MSSQPAIEELLKSASERLKEEARKVIPQPRKHARKDATSSA
jgi:hypothetical protein